MSCVKAIINLAALLNNYQVARKAAPNSKLYAVVKSNAYGHGLEEIAKALPDADGLAVARLNEALLLRQKGIRQPIVVLGGVFRDVDIRRASAQQIDLVVHNQDQVDHITSESNRIGMRAKTLWIKVDTGMHRLGFLPNKLAAVHKTLSESLPNTSLIMMTHLSKADLLSDKRTTVQMKRFQKVSIKGCAESIANSAGILAWPNTHADIVRPGIMLYGSSPVQEKSAKSLGLLPVMTLYSELLAIKKLKKGDHVGYGGDWVCPRNMLIGVVAIGYGDGYPRHAKQGTPVLVNGVKTTLIGRVSMDMICVDLSAAPKATLGDEVVLWGEGLAADEVAEHAGTIAYELFCGVTSRVEFEYKRNG